MGRNSDAPGASVLVVEDDRAIAELVATYLERDGERVRIAGSAAEALALRSVEPPDLVILDLGLPDADGLEFLRTLRTESLVPVIIVSARESDEDKVQGFGLGADDFVSKPFSPRVLAARVRAQLRRAAYAGPGGPTLERIAFGPFVLDFAGRLLSRSGERVALSRKEFELLSYLVKNAGRSFSPEELYKEVWRLDHGDLSTVAVHIQRIRRKIEDVPSSPIWVQTVPGAGYRFVAEEDAP
jgi:two-component system response regulator RegX3